MADVVIENPILNSPFAEPVRHFKFNDDGITDLIVSGRRNSSYFVPIAQPKKKSKQQQQTFDEWTADRIEENKNVNAIRQRVKLWRDRGYGDVTRTTLRLLQHWNSADRNRRLFFCQIEAMETVIYITEVAKKTGDVWIDNELRNAAESANPGLFRLACKMATGAGKTTVMAMLIAWQTLNKLANPQDARYADAFLLVAPGITIRDRLRVLLPSDPESYYVKQDIVPADLLGQIGKAKVVIANYHGFKRRERGDASRMTKQLLGADHTGAFVESDGEMVRRVCRELGNKRNIVVINDEAHHCYRRRIDDVAIEAEPAVKLSGDDKREADARNEEARVWISGLEAIAAKIGIKAVYDLSATPFFLKGSGYSEGTLFPWVISDFSLIDAIESGIVKVPRVPVSDNSMQGAMPTYRDLWLRIREDLPKKGRGANDVSGGDPRLPAELEGALQSLYANYAKSFERWKNNTDARANGLTPPVFIVVCNNTNVSKLVFDYVAGYEKTLPGGTVVAVPGRLPLFSNVKGDRFTNNPNTILVDSSQLESGESMSDDFKKFAAREIDEFKADLRARFPGRDVDELTDEDLLREVMNTVGKPGKLGEEVKCVVSVSMLTEGWDANTVTHILGIRAFGTQLLCEQVVGRGLRRMSYVTEPTTIQTPAGPVTFNAFPPEYAEVYGVPFSFIPSAGAGKDPKPGPMPTHVRALPERSALAIQFPRLDGYRYELPAERLSAKFTDESCYALSTADVPTSVENAPIVGQSSVHNLDDLKRHRPQTVAFHLARRIHERYFELDEQTKMPWLFPDLLRIAGDWMSTCLTCKDDTFPQLLLFIENAERAADRIYRAIVRGSDGEKRLIPVMKPYDPIGTTDGVSFDTVRATYRTRADKCPISHVVGDTESWEQKLAQTLEVLPGLHSYVKNHNLGFFIPYTADGQHKNYIPDFIARIDDGHGADDLLNLIIEVTGEKDEFKKAKVETAKTLWIPAVNNSGAYGRWAFVEITDPWNARVSLLGSLEGVGV